MNPRKREEESLETEQMYFEFVSSCQADPGPGRLAWRFELGDGDSLRGQNLNPFKPPTDHQISTYLGIEINPYH